MMRLIKYLLIFPLIAITSCVREPFESPDPCPCDDERDVTLKLALPYAAPQPATRSIGPAQENAIETLDILAFKVEGGVETFLYWSEAKKQTGNTEGAQTQSFTAMLRIKEFQQRFVLISNARSKVATLMGSRPSGGWQGIEKEEMLSQLIFDLNGSDRWNVFSASNYTPIPMTGESAPVTVSAETTTISGGPIQMLRMIAKIEVQLDTNITGLTDLFQLTSVHLYNTNTSGRIAPIPGHIGGDKIAILPSLPASVEMVEGPLAYADFGLPGLTGVAMRGAIYLFETEAKNSGVVEETCIVVGGLYGADTQESFYRLDFFVDDSKMHWDILRNYRYICNIVNVKGRGFPTVDDAYRSKSLDMEVEILAWDEGVYSDVKLDGQYMLGVSHDRFDLDSDVHDTNSLNNILKITTNFPTGWTAFVSGNTAGTTPASWLSISAASGAGNGQPHAIRLLTSANHGDERTAYIHIKAGRITYLVTVVQDVPHQGIIAVAPKMIRIPNIFIPGGLYNVQVTCTKTNGDPDPGANWTLTSDDPSWLKLSLDPATTFSAATASVSGTGNQTVYLYAPDNLTVNTKRTTIHIGASPLDIVVDVMQMGNTTVITDNEGGGTLPTGVNSYVGAFWRANQTGERIIRINAGANNANHGAWTATVMWMDGRWGTDDGIMIDQNNIDASSLAARGISFTSKMNPDAYGTPENFPVSGYMASGTVNSTDRYIMFRIGLKSTYTPSTSYPVRYAIVLLSYAGNSKHQKIFLRQGEEADYLLTNNDPVLSTPDKNGNLTARTVCRQFVPYNLTADILDADPGINGGRFVDYPTQAGAFFQWANNYPGAPQYGYTPAIRKAWNPYSTKAVGTWATSYATGFWNTLAATHETSPPGYRRPTDGSITANVNINFIDNSEIRQSLLQKPVKGVNYTADISNSMKGYYADGFFDRRQIVTGPGIQGDPLTAVEADNRNIAYFGNLFFNTIPGSDRYGASLFFPIAGLRDWTDGGQLHRSGTIGAYWTSSVYDNVSAMFLRFIPADNTSAIWADAKYLAYSVRCVKIPQTP